MFSRASAISKTINWQPFAILCLLNKNRIIPNQSINGNTAIMRKMRKCIEKSEPIRITDVNGKKRRLHHASWRATRIFKRRSVDRTEFLIFSDCWLLSDQRMLKMWWKWLEDWPEHCNYRGRDDLAEVIWFSSKNKNTMEKRLHFVYFASCSIILIDGFQG